MSLSIFLDRYVGWNFFVCIDMNWFFFGDVQLEWEREVREKILSAFDTASATPDLLAYLETGLHHDTVP